MTGNSEPLSWLSKSPAAKKNEPDPISSTCHRDHDSHLQIMIGAAFLPEQCRPMSGAGFRGRKQRPVMLIHSLQIEDFHLDSLY